jgi:hypothetical protein
VTLAALSVPAERRAPTDSAAIEAATAPLFGSVYLSQVLSARKGYAAQSFAREGEAPIIANERRQQRVCRSWRISLAPAAADTDGTPLTTPKR